MIDGAFWTIKTRAGRELVKCEHQVHHQIAHQCQADAPGDEIGERASEYQHGERDRYCNVGHANDRAGSQVDPDLA
jgi:hypothetical protein